MTLAKIHKPFELLAETLKSYERVMLAELESYLPDSEDYVMFMLDAEISCSNGLVLLPLPDDLLILDDVIEVNGKGYLYQPFKLICDHEIA